MTERLSVQWARHFAGRLLERFEEAVPNRNARLAIGGVGLVGAYLLTRKATSPRLLPAIGKAVLVTGCDTPLGFGTSIARRLHQLGYVVFAACLDAKTTKEKVYSDLKNSETFHVIQMDVTNQGQVDKAVEEVDAWLAAHHTIRLYGIVNNAGIVVVSPVEWLHMDTFTKIFDVNCFGMLRVTKAFLPLIRKGGPGGSVVNMASIAGELPGTSGSAYNGSKAAVLMISECLRIELATFGIKVSCVCPDFYNTNIVADIDRNVAALKRECSLVKPEAFQAYGGKDRAERLTKSVSGTIPKLAKTDISPVVNCVIDGIANPNPRIRYRPIDVLSGVVLGFYNMFPSAFLAIQDSVFSFE